MLCEPTLSVLLVIDHTPSTLAVVVPIIVDALLSKRKTVAKGSVVPTNVGVVTDVMLSAFESPSSLIISRSGIEGAIGA